jgi:hypothetical protein
LFNDDASSSSISVPSYEQCWVAGIDSDFLFEQLTWQIAKLSLIAISVRIPHLFFLDLWVFGFYDL